MRHGQNPLSFSLETVVLHLSGHWNTVRDLSILNLDLAALLFLSDHEDEAAPSTPVPRESRQLEDANPK